MLRSTRSTKAGAASAAAALAVDTEPVVVVGTRNDQGGAVIRRRARDRRRARSP